MSRRAHPLIRELAARRVALGLSQGAVADRIGVSRLSVTRWESGHQDTSIARLAAYAQAVGLRLTLVSEDGADG